MSGQADRPWLRAAMESGGYGIMWPTWERVGLLRSGDCGCTVAEKQTAATCRGLVARVAEWLDGLTDERLRAATVAADGRFALPASDREGWESALVRAVAHGLGPEVARALAGHSHDGEGVCRERVREAQALRDVEAFKTPISSGLFDYGLAPIRPPAEQANALVVNMTGPPHHLTTAERAEIPFGSIEARTMDCPRWRDGCEVCGDRSVPGRVWR